MQETDFISTNTGVRGSNITLKQGESYTRAGAPLSTLIAVTSGTITITPSSGAAVTLSAGDVTNQPAKLALVFVAITDAAFSAITYPA